MQMYILQNVKYVLQRVETNDLTRVQVTSGMTIMKTPGVFIAVFGVYCICALCIGMSSAADITMSTANHNSTFNAGPGHRLSPETIIANHEHKGVNASVVKTALRNGNNATVMTWLESHRAAHPAVIKSGRVGFDLTNSTQQQQIITRLEKNGVNVTDFKTDLLNGNTDAAKTWLENYFQTHKPAMGAGAGKAGFDLTNSTQQQQIITRLEKNGVNVTNFKTDLLNGNIDAAKALLDVFMQAHRNNATAHIRSSG